MQFFRRLASIFALLAVSSVQAEEVSWEIEKTGLDGSRTIFRRNGDPLVQWVAGEKELKPYLHVYGKDGDLLTEWSPDQQFSHHRGIFIGWNRVRSELGTYDLWHLRNGGKMKATGPSRTGPYARETRDDTAFISEEIEWHAGEKDEEGSSLLIREVRTFVVTPLGEGHNQIDARFQLTAARDVQLDGDLQHSGIHFRGSKELLRRKDETSYVWEPPLPGRGGKVESPDLKWCRLIFPIGDHWYSATQMNAPSNPVEELSWRDYGRFGFFFKRKLEKGETLDLHYRFVTQPAEAPSGRKHTAEELEPHRADSTRLYEQYISSLKGDS